MDILNTPLAEEMYSLAMYLIHARGIINPVARKENGHQLVFKWKEGRLYSKDETMFFIPFPTAKIPFAQEKLRQNLENFATDNGIEYKNIIRDREEEF